MNPTEAHASVSLIDFPLECLPTVWEWLNEFPDANFDDQGPKTFEEFDAEMRARIERGERLWGVTQRMVLVGVVGYAPITKRLGSLHGVCFSKTVHGWGVARAAMRLILQELFNSGVEKVSASYFASNTRVERFLLKLGAQYEGTMLKHTTQKGLPIDMRLVALFKE